MAPRKKTGPVDSVVPELPVAPPPVGGDWQMTALNQLTGSVGRLEASINALSNKVGELKDDLSEVEEKVEQVERKILVASTVIGIALAVATLVGGAVVHMGDKAIDFAIDVAKERLKEPPSVDSGK